MENIIKATGLKFLELVNYPDMCIKRGKMTFICGESGCGKSTFLRLINNTENSSGGFIEYDGRKIQDIDTIKLRREVLLASQEVYLFEGTIRDNFQQYYNYRGEQCIDEVNMKEYLSICCADFPLDTRCEIMSGGERQRVFMAICLSFMPKVLMLDEPTAALDEATSIKYFHNVKKFCGEHGITVIAICHNPKMVEIYADECITLERGGYGE
ncbi:putative ABC transport system ATP-binding protein [Hathewaya proteolytica DSM 3090]|uniref:Putative ABC transport system ATP-binding protein n=1 Tax=Hathewaya proteolytica DSM 3090 TaxID=1121331 RepID=A0A1M6PFT7_9CLOT|nr:ABC transporter ATP-binding protein [Hathewaya proteolytica]SHK06815.1 putative ABC transport system ATP-binding protein [Hathewaya proteolytica DSM 3090]